LNAIEDFYIKLEGPPDADKRDLLHQAIQITCLRLKLTGPQRAAINIEYVPENITFVEHFGEINAVEVRARIRYTPQDNIDYVVVSNDNIGMPLAVPDYRGHSYNRFVNPTPELFGRNYNGARDPASTLLLSCYLQTPPGEHRIGAPPPALLPPAGSVDVSGSPPPSPPPTYPPPDTITRYTPTSASTSASSDPPLTAYSADARTAPYTHAAMTIKYITDVSRIALAKGTGSPSTGHEDTTVIAQLAANKGMIELRYEFERNGQPPAIPPMLDTINFNSTLKGKLVYSDVTPTSPPVTPSMQHRYFHITGIYRYALNRPVRSDESLSFGALPYTSFTTQNTTFKLADLASGALTLNLFSPSPPTGPGGQAAAAVQAAANADPSGAQAMAAPTAPAGQTPSLSQGMPQLQPYQGAAVGNQPGGGAPADGDTSEVNTSEPPPAPPIPSNAIYGEAAQIAAAASTFGGGAPTGQLRYINHDFVWIPNQ